MTMARTTDQGHEPQHIKPVNVVMFNRFLATVQQHVCRSTSWKLSSKRCLKAKMSTVHHIVNIIAFLKRHVITWRLQVGLSDAIHLCVVISPS